MSFVKLHEFVQCQYVQSRPYGSDAGNLALYCPSLMPMIGMGTPKTTPVSLNKSAYCNSNECKPSVSSKITTQNYITGKANYHDFDFPCYWYGTGITVRADKEDMLECTIWVEEEDNSTPWP